MIEKLGNADYVLPSKSDVGKEHWYYYGGQSKDRQFLRIVINKEKKIERFEVRYLPDEYLK